MSGVTGDFAGLSAARERVAQLAGAVERTARAAVPKLAEILDEQFRLGLDPSSDPWAPLAPSTVARGRHAPPLTDTGLMHAGATVTSDGGTITMRLDTPAEHHQYGTANMVARALLPSDAEELPPAYALAMAQSASSAMGGEA